MSLLQHLPAEVIRLICHRLPLEDVISLVDSDPAMDIIVRNTLFRDMKKLEIDWNVKGTALIFSGPSLPSPISIHSSSNFWEDVLQRAVHLREIILIKSEDAKNYSILDSLFEQNLHIRHLEIRLRKGQRSVSQNTLGLSYQKLTSLVRHFRRTLCSLRLETDDSNSVEVKCDSSSAVFHFAHAYDSSLCNRLITPMFNTFVGIGYERCSVTHITLRVDYGEKAGLILQSAFHAALPFEHRSRVLVLRLELGTGISKKETPELSSVLSAYAPYLNSVNRLQHFICDLRHSSLDPSELETLYTTMSQELSNDRHRISLLTNAIACQ